MEIEINNTIMDTSPTLERVLKKEDPMPAFLLFPSTVVQEIQNDHLLTKLLSTDTNKIDTREKKSKKSKLKIKFIESTSIIEMLNPVSSDIR